jgi:hypothetical protein
MFLADEETGDVFLRPGFRLTPRKHYFITLQVSGKNIFQIYPVHLEKERQG